MLEKRRTWTERRLIKIYEASSSCNYLVTVTPADIVVVKTIEISHNENAGPLTKNSQKG